MDQLLGDERVARGFRVKFPEDVLQDNLAGQLWFGAEVRIFYQMVMFEYCWSEKKMVAKYWYVYISTCII